MREKLRVVWRGICATASCAFLYLLYVLLSYAVLHSIGNVVLTAAIVDVIGIIACAAWLIHRCKPGELEGRAPGWLPSVQFLFVCVVAWYVSQVGASWINSLGDEAYAAYSSAKQVSIGATVFTSLILAPVFEEVFFRGVMGRKVSMAAGHFASAVVTSIIFCVAHGTWTHVLPTITIGLCAYASRLRWGLAGAILLHVGANVGALLVAGTPEPGPLAYPQVFFPVMGFLWVILLIELYHSGKIADAKGVLAKELTLEDGMAKVEFSRLFQTVFDDIGAPRDCGADARKLYLRRLYDELDVEPGILGDPETGDIDYELAYEAGMYLMSFEDDAA